ncbi:hypothetical protein FQA39_LY04444 [Lamprigera yunnana]|nr:hypothetical protein FQA39_LY04444 [Lamprigera yunnana]
MSNAFPSLATLYRQLDENPTIVNGTVRIETLKTYLLKRNLPLHIFLGEDQTAIMRRVQYDHKTNKMIGFALPSFNKTGLPDITKFIVTCVQNIEDAFKNEEICGNVNNKFKAEDVLRRWNYLHQEAKKIVITIERFSTNGDSRCLIGMKINSQLPSTFESKYSPYFQVSYQYLDEINLDKPVYMQDTMHICTKLKTRLTNSNVTMIMGNFNVYNSSSKSNSKSNEGQTPTM